MSDQDKRKHAHVTIEDRRRAIRMVDDGNPKKEVAQRFGVSRPTLISWLKRKQEYIEFKGTYKAI